MNEDVGTRTKNILPVISFITFIGFLDTHLLIPVMALYAYELGAGIGIVGLVIGLYSIINTPANIFLGAYFTPSYGRYWVIIAFPDFLDDGIEGHDEFVMAGGTYYGGPVYYDPKGINPNPID